MANIIDESIDHLDAMANSDKWPSLSNADKQAINIIINDWRQMNQRIVELRTALAAKEKPKLPPANDGYFGLDGYFEQCNRILDKISKLPDSAAGFGESVQKNVEGVRFKIQSGVCTPKMKSALNGWEEAIDEILS